MGHNKFSVWTDDEFAALFEVNQERMADGGHPPGEEICTHAQELDPNQGEIDWRDKGAVTDVIDQGPCRSDWAIATVGAVESMMFVKSGNL